MEAFLARRCFHFIVQALLPGEINSGGVSVGRQSPHCNQFSSSDCFLSRSFTARQIVLPSGRAVNGIATTLQQHCVNRGLPPSPLAYTETGTRTAARGANGKEPGPGAQGGLTRDSLTGTGVIYGVTSGVPQSAGCTFLRSSVGNRVWLRGR
jgi:hypothetical protein